MDSTAAEIREGVRQVLADHAEVISMHGFYYDHTDNAIKFDVVTGFEVRDRAGLARRIAKQVSKRYPGYSVDVVVDYEITD